MIYAIDFGTSNSLLAAGTRDGVFEPIELDPQADDPSIMKSVFFIAERDHWHFGADAIDQYSDYFSEGRLLRSIKKYLPDPGFYGTEIFGKLFRIEDLIGVFLGEMRQRANRILGQDVRKVVLGRPAAFSMNPELHDLAEKRLIDAAKRAGFEEVFLCPEPLAASFEFRSQLQERKLTLIADFGGGTSDFTVLHLGPESYSEADVLSLGGLSVAGDAFDGAIMKHHIAQEFGTGITYRLPMGSVDLGIPKHIINKMLSPADMSFLAKDDILTLLKDAQKWSLGENDRIRMERLFTMIEDRLAYRVFEEIEKAKRSFADHSKVDFILDYPGIDVELEISAEEFSLSSTPQIDQIMKVLDQTVEDAGVEHKDIEIVCCTGGTSRIKGLRRELEARFGTEKLSQHRQFHSVINGLAERAHQLCRNSEIC